MLFTIFFTIPWLYGLPEQAVCFDENGHSVRIAEPGKVGTDGVSDEDVLFHCECEMIIVKYGLQYVIPA